MWLQDLLPQSIPDARIMTYGFDSEARTARHLIHHTLYTQADRLIAHLYSLRQNTQSNTRPIIFVGHSLGGVLIKSALVRASIASPYNGEQSQAIKTFVNGIIFLGTPHQGSQQISWGKILYNIVSIVSKGEKLPRWLERESAWLELQLELFKSIAPGLSICYGCEARPVALSQYSTFVSHQ